MIVLNNSLKVQDKKNLEIRFVKPWTAVFKVARKSCLSVTLLQFEQLGPVQIDDAALKTMKIAKGVDIWRLTCEGEQTTQNEI